MKFSLYIGYKVIIVELFQESPRIISEVFCH